MQQTTLEAVVTGTRG